MAKEKTLEVILKARDETERATRESAQNIRKLQQEWSGLDKSIRKAQAAKQRRRDQADTTLQRQQIRLLEREADAGSKAAAVELRRTKITQEFAQEKRELQKIINSERTSDRQKIAAQRQLATLDQQRARTLAQVNDRQRRGNALLGTLKGRLVGLAAGAGAMASIGAAARGVIQSMQEVTRETIAFEKTMTELLSLGDNLQNIDAIKNEVVSLSNALGTSRQEVARTLFDLQSGTANLDQTVRDELLRSAVQLNQVYGGELPTSLRNMVKVFQIFGESAADAATIQRRLAFTAEQGFLTFEEMAQQLPDVASAADAMGASLNEVLASLIVATQRGGKTEKTFTGVRNVFLRMSKAQKEGIALTGDFTDRLRQLNAAAEDNPELLKKVFGDEALAAANNMLASVEDIDSAIGKLSGKLPDLGDKLADRFEDAASATAAMVESFKQLQRNALVNASPGVQQQVVQFEAAKAGFKQRFPLLPDAIGDIASFAEATLLGPQANTRRGFETAIRDAIEQGQFERAELRIDELRRAEGFPTERVSALFDQLQQARFDAIPPDEAEPSQIEQGRAALAERRRARQARHEARENRLARVLDTFSGAREALTAGGLSDAQANALSAILTDDANIRRIRDQALELIERNQALEAQTRLRELNRDILREEAKAGDEAAEQELRRLKLAEQLTERREQLQKIITDVNLDDDLRDRARELLERAEDAARDARTAGAAALQGGDAGEQPDAGGAAIAAIGRRQARFLAFENGSVGESPEAKTARNTEQANRKLDKIDRSLGLLADLWEQNRQTVNIVPFRP